MEGGVGGQRPIFGLPQSPGPKEFAPKSTNLPKMTFSAIFWLSKMPKKMVQRTRREKKWPFGSTFQEPPPKVSPDPSDRRERRAFICWGVDGGDICSHMLSGLFWATFHVRPGTNLLQRLFLFGQSTLGRKGSNLAPCPGFNTRRVPGRRRDWSPPLYWRGSGPPVTVLRNDQMFLIVLRSIQWCNFQNSHIADLSEPAQNPPEKQNASNIFVSSSHLPFCPVTVMQIQYG